MNTKQPDAKPVIVSRMPPDFGNVGGTTVALGLGALQRVAYLDHKDGISRSHTIIVGATRDNGQSNANLAGAAVRVTVGNERGSQFYWSGAPCVLPAIGSRIIVDAMLTTTPFLFNTGSITTPWTTPTPFPGPANPGISVSANVFEGWSDYPAPDLLASLVSIPSEVVLIGGPVYVQGMTFKNQSASAVRMLVFDNKGPFPPGPTNIVTSVVVPATSTIGLGASALGPFAQGVSCMAVTDLTSGTPYTVDANGANVLVDVFGNYFALGGV